MYLSGLLLLQNVQPNAPTGTPGVAVPSGPAPAPQGSPPGSSPFFTLAMLLMFVPFLFLMFRRNKKEDEARSKLKKGDRIQSQSGLVGELVEMDERFAKVKLGPGNTVTMLRSSIQPLDAGPAPKADEKDLKDLKDAKALAEKK